MGDKKNSKIEIDLELAVPEWHKKLVRERVRTAKKSDFKPWSEVKKQLHHK